jgi:thiol:disulfide interchange protein DsbA
MARKKWKKKERIAQAEKSEVTGDKGTNKVVVIGALLLIVVAGYYVFGPPSNPPVSTAPPQQLSGKYELVDKPSTHITGKVQLVEFYDFTCSHCYDFHKEVWPALEDRYGERVELVDLGYPLRPTSFKPIEAYEIAKDLGKGEEMKDALFFTYHVENKDISNVKSLGEMAGYIGLDKDAFTNSLDSKSKRSIVDENIRLGNSYNLRGTPTFVIDGNLKVTDNSLLNLIQIIDSILEEE